MKKLIPSLAILASLAAAFAVSPSALRADPPDGADEIIAVTIRADGSTNTWTRQDAFDALGLLNRKYWRDMSSPQRRIDWHGRCTSAVTDTNTSWRVWRYEDGFAYSNIVRRAEAATTNIVDNIITIE